MSLLTPTGPHLDAPFEHVARGEGALPEQFTEDDNLLEEEHAPLLGPGRHTGVQLDHVEGVLLQQLPLGGQGALAERGCGEAGARLQPSGPTESPLWGQDSGPDTKTLGA